MKLKVLTHASDPNHHGLIRWKKSIDRYDYDYVILNDPNFNWAVSYPTFLNWAKENRNECSHILITDCFDVVVLGSQDELAEKYTDRSKFLWSVEKASFPDPSLAQHYDPTPYAWKYINCGGGLFQIDLFIEIFDKYDKTNIQDWAAKNYLFTDRDKINLDTNCDIFQSIAFIDPSDFSTEGGRVINNYTKTKPIFIHNNGGGATMPEWVTDLLEK